MVICQTNIFYYVLSVGMLCTPTSSRNSIKVKTVDGNMKKKNKTKRKGGKLKGKMSVILK